jgi:hypothetical protein
MDIIKYMKTNEKYSKKYFKRLYLEIGNKYDKLQVIEIKNIKNDLIIEYTPKKYVNQKLFSKKINIKFETFFEELLKINIEKWDNEYTSKLFSGHEWNLKLYFRQNIIIEKQGSNNFPENFIELINLIKTHYKEFNVDISIRTELNEIDLLKLYCSYHRGFSFFEVSIGNKNIFGINSKNRRIDIVRILCDHKYIRIKYSENRKLFNELINNYEIEIVEIKNKLNRPVIGQIIVAEYMLKKLYNIKSMTKAILYHEGDEALELLCKIDSYLCFL